MFVPRDNWWQASKATKIHCVHENHLLRTDLNPMCLSHSMVEGTKN